MNRKPHALLIDDDTEFLNGLVELIRQEGFLVTTAGTLNEARERLEDASPDLVVSDLMLPDGSGVEVLQWSEEGRRFDVVLVSGQATVDSAIEALRQGALDYLTKPVDIPRLSTVLTNVIRTRALKGEIGALRNELRKLGRFGSLIGGSPQMQNVYDLIAKVAPTEASVFIMGESGSGKELVAQTVHELSARREKMFLPLNCGAIPPTLIESELFGHERGSFTGATQLRRGHFERASGGTLFLDEITEMPIGLQVKLLRVIETGTVMRVGGDVPIPIDLRLIAATNRVPEEAVKEGKLREDLFYRLNVFPITLPPLHEREGDALHLAEFFLDALNHAEKATKSFSPSARERIKAYRWPGNVRELKNEIQRAFILCENTITFENLSIGSPAPAADSSGALQSIRPGASIAEVERQLIFATLDYCDGDKKRAADVLGISLKTLYNRLNQYAAV